MRKILSDLQLSRDAKSDLAIALRDLDNKGKEILYAFPHMATDITVERGLLPPKKVSGVVVNNSWEVPELFVHLRGGRVVWIYASHWQTFYERAPIRHMGVITETKYIETEMHRVQSATKLLCVWQRERFGLAPV
jgi:hypothetical protein